MTLETYDALLCDVVHIHTKPDYTPRLMDDIEVATQAPEKGMRAIVLKGHIPRPTDGSSGCRFHTCYPIKLGEICEREAPPGRQPAPGHTIYCHQPVEVLTQLEILILRSAAPTRRA